MDTTTNPTRNARLAEISRLSDRRARQVAMSLGLKVTRDRRYLPHYEVCNAAASADVSDSKWAAAVALATGRAVAAADAPHDANVKVSVDDDAALAAIITDAVAAATAELEPRIAEIARAAVDEKRRVEHVLIANGAVRVIGHTVHRQFDRLLRMVQAGVNVWMAGPAGSGKTTAAEQCAKALGLRFYSNGAIDSEYKLSGFVDAQGRIVSTAFREAFTNGGVYLFDEVDASMPGAVLAFNAALANGHADFPGVAEPVAKHADFRCIAAANTWGFGATSEYVGRMKLDAAFIDRFVQLTWDYDEALEAALASDAAWCKRVQDLRAKARARGLKVVISPRATINGCKLLAAGFTVDEALDATVRAKISAADWDNLSR